MEGRSLRARQRLALRQMAFGIVLLRSIGKHNPSCPFVFIRGLSLFVSIRG
jgi:hypothetical protein